MGAHTWINNSKGMLMEPQDEPLRGRVLRLLLMANLENLHAADVAACLNMSASTLRRRLKREGTSYQELLDNVRQHRCERILQRRWVPGKCLATRLGFTHANSFYRAFKKWTGVNYTDHKRTLKRDAMGSFHQSRRRRRRNGKAASKSTK